MFVMALNSITNYSNVKDAKIDIIAANNVIKMIEMITETAYMYKFWLSSWITNDTSSVGSDDNIGSKNDEKSKSKSKSKPKSK